MVRKCVWIVLLALFSPQVLGKDVTLRLDGNIDVAAREERFEPAVHDLKGCGNGSNFCEVDGVLAYGGISVPKSSLTKLTVKVGDATYELNTSGMFNPLLSSLDGSFGGFCYDAKNCAFRAVFGDAGGIYAAEWTIKDGIAHRTTLSDSADLFHFFKSHLSPPQYH